MFFNTDMYITKYFDLFSLPLSLFLKIYNVFDTANEINVYTDTGRAGYTLALMQAEQVAGPSAATIRCSSTIHARISIRHRGKLKSACP